MTKPVSGLEHGVGGVVEQHLPDELALGGRPHKGLADLAEVGQLVVGKGEDRLAPLPDQHDQHGDDDVDQDAAQEV